ncbi:ATP-binding protein [Streptomyces sp. WMMB 714]|uniref:ATP-binding protein n=1 Tax=Streptomyces sp. WMMB 714 TaxID=1286822 RepID=UPI00099E09AA|nr:ATP-binding protein [Streptomyces sp. WMMB 714]
MQVLQVQLEIGADPEEVGRARRWARSRLAACGVGADEQLAETLLLLVSELVTNAVVHTDGPAVLRMLLPGRLAPGAVRVEVADMSSVPPRQRRADGDDTHGRGLELVSGLADRWGWQREGAGKRIWCELDRVPDARERASAGAVTGKAGRPVTAAGSEKAAAAARLADGPPKGVRPDRVPQGAARA